MIWMTWALAADWSIPRGFPIVFGDADVVDIRVSVSRRRFVVSTEEDDAGERSLRHRDHRGHSVEAPGPTPPPTPELCGGPCTLQEFEKVDGEYIAIVTNAVGAARRVIETVEGKWRPVGTPRAGARSLHEIDGGLAVVFQSFDAPLRVGLYRGGDWDLLEDYDLPRDPDTSYGRWALAERDGVWHLARIASSVDVGDQLELISWTDRWKRRVLPISEPLGRDVEMVATKKALWLAWSDDAGLQVARDVEGSTTRQALDKPGVDRFELFAWRKRVCVAYKTPRDEAPRARLLCKKP